MSYDLVEQFKELSVSTPNSAPLNKNAYLAQLGSSNFSAFDSIKLSTRLILNYKDMSMMGLKAGSLVRLFSDGDFIPNVFEVWPSVVVKNSEIGFGSQKLSIWLKINSLSKLYLFHVNMSKYPIQIADKIEIQYLDDGLKSRPEQLHHWLADNVMANGAKYFVFHDSKELFFKVKIESKIESEVFSYNQDITIITEASVENKKAGLSLGGLQKYLDEVLKISKPFLFPDESKDYKIKMPCGVLLYGPPGCGKTFLAKALSEQVKVPVFQISSSDLSAGGFGEAESKLKAIFDDAKFSAPSIIFLDEIDALCPKRDSSSGSSSIRITTLLLSLMDGCNFGKDSQKVFFLGSTNMIDSIDSALRRPGRFDREIEISPPTSSDRFEILCSLLTQYPNNLSDQHVSSIADTCHGYVGSDLALLCKEAYLNVLKKFSKNDDKEMKLTFDDLKDSYVKIRPSAMREVFIEVPKVKWSDIGGQNMAKQKLIECVEWPMKYPERFIQLGIKPPRGVLLFGPPGCSKTLMAKALASESGLNFLAVKGPEIFSKYVGDSEKRIRDIFKKARQSSPSIIFFDEFDSIAGRSESSEGSSVSNRVMSQLLNEMDGLEPLLNVIVVAATNKPDLIDKALLRPGRFDRHIYIKLPDLEGRTEIFRILKKKMPFSDDFTADKVANLTEGLSGAEITSLCQNAAIKALERNVESSQVLWQDFEECLSSFQPQISKESLTIFEKFIE